jgi:hypothetical protein
MTNLTKSTVKMLCVRSGIARKEISEEAQKLLDLYNDPNTDPETKAQVKKKIEEAIRVLEERVTTRRLREAKRQTASEDAGPEPSVS